MYWKLIAKRLPASATSAAESAWAASLYRAAGTPTSSAASMSCRIAPSAAPNGLALRTAESATAKTASPTIAP